MTKRKSTPLAAASPSSLSPPASPSPSPSPSPFSGPNPSPLIEIERVQTGVRMEKRILKVLKGLAELTDLSLGDLLEGIVLHAFEGKAPFHPETLQKIAELKRIYGLDLDARASHRLKESDTAAKGPTREER